MNKQRLEVADRRQRSLAQKALGWRPMSGVEWSEIIDAIGRLREERNRLRTGMLAIQKLARQTKNPGREERQAEKERKKLEEETVRRVCAKCNRVWFDYKNRPRLDDRCVDCGDIECWYPQCTRPATDTKWLYHGFMRRFCPAHEPNKQEAVQ